MDIGRYFHINKLKQTRQEFGYTQEQVRKRLGLNSRTLLSYWESGKTMPTPWYLFALSNLYQCSPLDLYPKLNKAVIKELMLNDNNLFELENEKK
jgi:transcriptional regulator with XRE-family HTH domain